MLLLMVRSGQDSIYDLIVLREHFKIGRYLLQFHVYFRSSISYALPDADIYSLDRDFNLQFHFLKSIFQSFGDWILCVCHSSGYTHWLKMEIVDLSSGSRKELPVVGHGLQMIQVLIRNAVTVAIVVGYFSTYSPIYYYKNISILGCDFTSNILETFTERGWRILSCPFACSHLSSSKRIGLK